MNNTETANNFLVRAQKAIDSRDFELADRYTAMAAVVMQGATNDKIIRISNALDRIADILNNGNSWR